MQQFDGKVRRLWVGGDAIGPGILVPIISGDLRLREAVRLSVRVDECWKDLNRRERVVQHRPRKDRFTGRQKRRVARLAMRGTRSGGLKLCLDPLRGPAPQLQVPPVARPRNHIDPGTSSRTPDTVSLAARRFVLSHATADRGEARPPTAREGENGAAAFAFPRPNRRQEPTAIRRKRRLQRPDEA